MAEKYDWSYENAISYTKETIDVGTHPHRYSAWRTNTYFSNFPDTVILANQMNGLHSSLDDDMQLRFLQEMVRKRKRFFKKDRPERERAFELVQNAYKYNVVKTREALSVLTDRDVTMLEELQEKGGT